MQRVRAAALATRLHTLSAVNVAEYSPYVADGVDGFIDAIDFSRVGEVRLADCVRLGKEQHLQPGDGDLNFGNMFRRIEAKGFKGHYTNAFGTLEDMLAGRDYLLNAARTAGVPV